MASEPRNNAAPTRGRPFAKGNPGRPKGARHKTTLAAEQLLVGEAKALARKCIDLALKGDPTALRLCMERIVPARKDRLIRVAMPPIEGVADHPAALAELAAAAASGEIAPAEAESLARVLAEHRKSVETADLAERIARLEERLPQR